MLALVGALVLALAPAHVARVVVYPDRAQVVRSQSVACGARALARFDGIPPAADPASLRARTSVGTVEGLRSEQHTLTDAYAGEVKSLDDKIRKLELDDRTLADADARRGNAERVAARYLEVAVSLVGREMSEPSPNVKAWGDALDLALATRVKAATDTVDTGAKRREIARQLDELRDKRARLAAASGRHEYVAEVLVGCPVGQNADVELSYTVGGASWEPAYEARADEAGGAVELATWATVKQTTGEDWSKAQVILSTAVPRQDATPPEIDRLNVWAEERKEQKKVLVRRDERQEHAEAAAAAGATAGTVAARAQGLSVQLVVPGASDVAGDGTPSRLLVGKTRMKARFADRTAPQRMPFVFRVADVTNGAPWPLLPGPLDAFRRSGLVGRYPLERVPEGGRFHLSFGVEDGVHVKRVVVEEVQRDKGLFGGTRRFRYAYRFELGNYTGHAEEVELSEHIPVSELDDVKVAVDDQTTGGYDRNADDGILTWKVPLKPGEERKLDVRFHVDVPSDYDSGAL